MPGGKNDTGYGEVERTFERRAEEKQRSPFGEGFAGLVLRSFLPRIRWFGAAAGSSNFAGADTQVTIAVISSACVLYAPIPLYGRWRALAGEPGCGKPTAIERA